MLDSFVFNNAGEQSLAHFVPTEHNVGLVVLSLLVAFISCCSAFHMVQSNRQAAALSHRRVSLFCASLVLGLGIWCMHFIGMLALHLPTPVSYNILGTSLSILPGMLAAGFALWSLQTVKPSILRMLGCGVVVCIGIGCMHYSGLAAMQFAGKAYIYLPSFLLSLLLGFVFSIAAFVTHGWIFTREGTRLYQYLWMLPALLLTVGIASMHYESMHALRFVLDTSARDAAMHRDSLENNKMLSLAIAVMASIVFLILGLANALLRYRDMWRAVAARDARLNAMIETARDGVITINNRGIVQDFNPSAQRIFGYAKEEVIGYNISMLMPSPLAEQHDGHLNKHMGKPDKPISVNGREVLGKHKDGHLFPLQLTIGKALTPSGTIFVGYLQDISERKRTDAQLRIAASVFQHVREGVAIVDANHNISDVNPAFLRLMEIQREDCVGKPLEQLYEDADMPPDMSKLWQTVAKHQYWQSEVMITRANNSVWMQRLSISPVLNELNRPHHFIAVISDVSERPGLEAILSHADLHDSATGLPSQKLFMDRLSNCLLTAKRKSEHVGAILIKARSIKSPSMQPGHADYVAILNLLAQLLHQQLRSTDTLSRYGENLLAILVPGIKDAASYRALVHRLGNSITENMQNYRKYGVDEIYIGFTSTLQCTGSASELMEMAADDLVPWTAQRNPLPQ